MRRALRVGCAAGLLGPPVALALLVAALDGPLEGAVRRRLERACTGALAQGRCRVGELHLSLPRGLQLGDLALLDAGGREVVGLDRLAVEIAPLALLRGRVDVVRLDLDGLRADLRHRDDGRLDLEALLPAAEEEGGGGTWEGLGVDLTVAEARVGLRSLALDGTPLLGDVELRLSAEVEGADVRVGRLALRGRLLDPADLPLALDASLALESGNLVVRELRAGLGGSALRASGRLASVLDAPSGELSVVLDPLEAADAAALAGGEVLAAALRAEGALRAAPDAWTLDLRLAPEGDDAGARLRVELPDDGGWRAVLESADLDLDRRLAGDLGGLRWAGRLAAAGDALAADAPVRAEFRVDRLEGWGQHLVGGGARARLADGRWTLDALDLRHRWGSAWAAGAGDLDGGRLEVGARLPVLGRLDAGLDGGAASLRGGLRVGWGGDALVATGGGELAVRGLEAGGVRVPAVVVPFELRLAGDGLEARGTLSAADAALPGGGSVRRLAGSWRLRRSAAGALSGEVRLAAVGVAAGGLRAEVGRVELRAEIAPTGAVRFRGELSGLALGGRPAPGGTVEGELAGRRLRLRADLADERWTLLRLRADADLDAGTLRADELVVGFDAERTLAARGPLRLAWTDGLEGSARLSGPAGDVAARGRRDADGRWRSLEVALEGVDLSLWDGLAPLLPDPPLGALAGRLDAQVRLDGDALDGEVRLRGLSVPGQLSGVDARLRVSGPTDRPRLHLDVDAGGGPVLALAAEVPLRDGRPDCAAEVRVDLLLAPRAASDLRAALPALGAALPEEAELSGRLVARGAACDPDLDATVALSAGAGEHGRRVRADVALRRRGGRLSVSGEVVEGLRRRLLVEGTARTGLGEVLGALLAGAGEVPPLARPSTWARDLDLRVVPLDVPVEVLGLFVPLPASVGGRLGGGLTLAGDPERPVVQGALLWVDGVLGGVPVQRATATLVPAGEDGGLLLRVDVGLGEGEDVRGTLVVDGRLPGAPGGGLAEDLRGFELRAELADLDLAALEGAVPGARALAGRASGALRLSGSLSEIERSGWLALEGAGAELPAAGVRVDDVDARLELDGDELRLASFRARSGPRYGKGERGTLELSGRARLGRDGPEDVLLSARARGFWLLARRDMQLAATGEVRASGDWPGLSLEGALTLERGRFVLDESFFTEDTELALAPELRIHRSVSPGSARPPPPPSLLERLSADLRLDIGDGLHLLAELPMAEEYGAQFAQLSTVGMDADLVGEGLQLRMAAGETDLVGTVEVLRGTARVFGVGLDLDRGGRVAFLGGDPTDPILDLSARRTVGSHGEVQVRITGPVSAMEIGLHSDEYPDPTDVVSLLVFGRPASELGGGEGLGGAALLQAALGSVTGSAVRELAGTGGAARLSFDGGSLRVGVPLSQKLFLAWEMRPAAEADENLNEVRLEWSIARRLYAEFMAGDRGASSADLYWRWRF